MMDTFSVTLASRISACLLSILLLSSVPISSTQADESELPLSKNVKPMLYATGTEFAEGPTLDAQGTLFVVNYRNVGQIGRIKADGTASVFCDLRELAPIEGSSPRANGLKLDRQGRLIASDQGAGRLLRIAADGSAVEVLADRYEGRRFDNLNDVGLDLKGNIYFSDPGVSSAENPTGSIYRYSIETGNITILDTGLAYPNGIGVTPDQKHLCVSESGTKRMLIYDLDASGKVSPRRVLLDFPQERLDGKPSGDHIPDGLVFDIAGRLYVGMWTGGVINVVDVETGKILRQYDAGGSKATNCHFGGEYLYTTVAAKEAVFRLKLGVKGFNYNGE